MSEIPHAFCPVGEASEAEVDALNSLGEEGRPGHLVRVREEDTEELELAPDTEAEPTVDEASDSPKSDGDRAGVDGWDRETLADLRTTIIVK